VKIEARIESIGGKAYPVIFFPDEIERDKTIGAYSLRDGHTSAARAYMRQCKKPETPEEYTAAYRLIVAYFNEALSYTRTL
jgi:hypothetical protein